MTISTTSSQATIGGNGSQTVFQFPFVGVSSSDITVSTISPSGIVTALSTSQYTLSLNAANPNQLWGIGGSVTLTSAPSTGTSILIQRTIPLTQQTSIQNQGNFYAQVTEQALDTLCMELQQISARTTQFRGTWVTATIYNVGDVVQDGVNGADTLNYYICNLANTSGVWATDLAAGDWAISVLATVPTTNQNITLSGAVTGNGTTSIITTFAKIPANSVLTNSSASSAVPTSLTFTANTVLGLGAFGSVSPLALNTVQSIIGTPSGTTNTIGVMIGQAVPFTPSSTGSIEIIAVANMANNSGNAGGEIQLRYGTGTAPTNGVSPTGTAIGNIAVLVNPTASANMKVPGMCAAQVSGLTTGLAYWIDLEQIAVTAGTFSISTGNIIAKELK